MKITKVKDYDNGIKLIDVERFEDSRGWFMETFRESQAGIPSIVQANQSYSRPHVMRGLHFQSKPYMGKLVRTINGHMIDIALDVRIGSPTFGEATLVDMPELPNKVQWLWVPAGFAHGNMFLTPTNIEYLCTGEYNGESEFCISPYDMDIKVVEGSNAVFEYFRKDPMAIITDKDRNGLSLKAWSDSDHAREFIYGQC